jgi:hypothetical protein
MRLLRGLFIGHDAVFRVFKFLLQHVQNASYIGCDIAGGGLTFRGSSSGSEVQESCDFFFKRIGCGNFDMDTQSDNIFVLAEDPHIVLSLLLIQISRNFYITQRLVVVENSRVFF